MKTYGFEEHVTNMRKPTFMTSEYSRFDSTNQESLMRKFQCVVAEKDKLF